MNVQERIRCFISVLAGALAMLAGFAALAQPYPAKQIEFVVHTSPGGGPIPESALGTTTTSLDAAEVCVGC